MEYNKLLKQLSVSTDTGPQRVVVEECKVTGDVIVRFGNSYTLRAAAGEVKGLLENILKIVVVDNNSGITAGGAK
jgi:hypothetical protein